MKKILAVTIILATLVISTLAFMPSASAQTYSGSATIHLGWPVCCSVDDSIVYGCQALSQIDWKMCMGRNGFFVDLWLMGSGFDW